MRRTSANAGMTLIEMLTCIVILAVLSSVTALVYDAMLDQLRLANKQVQLLMDVQHAQRFIVSDVRRASSLPDAYAAYHADDSTLICTVPAPDAAENAPSPSSVIVYTAGGGDGGDDDGRSLVRRVFPDAADPDSYSETIILSGVESVVFERSIEGAKHSVRFTISSANDLMHKNSPTIYSFVAGSEND